MKATTLPVVHILMATCQGEAYLAQQLESIEKQSYANWRLHVSDDGSTDKTLDILQAFKVRWEQVGAQNPLGHLDTQVKGGSVHLYQGPNQGPTENFMHLVRLLGEDPDVGVEDLFAFADQDDVWLPEKLERSVAWHLKERSRRVTAKARPMLYAAKSYLVDEALNPKGLSKTPKGPLAFTGALVENVLSGNTMVVNGALIQVLKRMQVSQAVWHDWSAYLVATACAGVLFYDEAPCVLYRQHEKNVIGVKTGWVEQGLRVRAVLRGRYKSWTQMNLNGLKEIDAFVTEDVRQIVQRFESLRLEKSIWQRVLKMRQLSLKRQNVFMQVLLYMGLALGVV